MSAMSLNPTATPTGPDWKLLLPNILLFQAGWFATILSAANGRAWMGLCVLGIALAVHLLRAVQPRREVSLILLATLIGFGFETLLASTGWVNYVGQRSAIPPFWMVALWGNFATTLNIALRSLRTRTWLLAWLGLVGGPLAYWGGVGLGAMGWLQTLPVLVYLALGWAILTPLLARLAMRLDGYGHGH